MTIKVRKLHPDAILPKYAKSGDAGMDIYALHDTVLMRGAVVSVPTGIAMEIPRGYFGSARERSSLALAGIHLGGGVIDSGYRGEFRGILRYMGERLSVTLKRGERIFQVVIQPCEHPDLIEAHELESSDRGAAGFGSTGK